MDSQYIYVLYLDLPMGEINYVDPDKSFANKVLIFDLQGKGVAQLHLDCRIGSLAINKARNKIYGIAQLPEFTIVEFSFVLEAVSILSMKNRLDQETVHFGLF